MSFIIFIILIIALWQMFFFVVVDLINIFKDYQVPNPLGVLESLINLLKNGNLIKASLNSLGRGIIGFLIAVIIGIFVGLLINRMDYLQKNLKPIILGIQTLPSVCWVPFAILWFGLTDKAILFVVIMGATFSIALSVDGAIKNVLPIYSKVALTMGANKKQLFVYVMIPAILPEFISGLKQGWSFGWRALMTSEVMTTSNGLGQALIIGRDLADINQVALVMIIIVIIVIIGAVIEKYVFSIIEKKILQQRGAI